MFLNYSLLFPYACQNVLPLPYTQRHNFFRQGLFQMSDLSKRILCLLQLIPYQNLELPLLDSFYVIQFPLFNKKSRHLEKEAEN